MSTTNNNLEDSNHVMCCAGCCIKEDDDINLRKCTACKSVRYCSVKCQRDHWPDLKEECKRAAGLRDVILFKQPKSSHLGDCPICLVPLSIDLAESTMVSCCSKLICNGCSYANEKRVIEGSLQPMCPFCRHPTPRLDEEIKINHLKRIEANDAFAMNQMGMHCNKEGDYKNAIAYCTKAAILGDVTAHYNLSLMYHKGHGVAKDEKNEVYHLEEAAIGGHPLARNNLAVFEGGNKGRIDRAVKHFMIAANQGYGGSLDALKMLYKEKGLVRKEDFAKVLRAHHAALNATKSPQREDAASVGFCGSTF